MGGTMRKLLAVGFALMTVLVLASPADAVHKGTIRRDFEGPDGPGGVHLTALLSVDDHDFQDQIRAIVVLSNPGPQNVTVHVSYLKLVKSGVGDVRNTGSFVVTIQAHDTRAYVTTYLNSPGPGVYHSRKRMWACWPGQPGDPCGGIVVWNSGNATYF